MTVKFTNNATTTVGSGINALATSLTVVSASSFPQLPGADDYCYLTIQGAISSTREVVKATALSSNTFTIVRAQDNTSAGTWSAGDIVELRMTAALLTDVIDAATVEGVKTNYQYTPTAGQTVFSGADNASATMIINQAALVSVYMNGVRLVQGTDYSVSSANNTVTLGIGATTADIIDIEVYGNFVGQSGAAVGITGGSITGTAITATSLGATGTATLNTLVSNNATISGGSLDGVTIGGTTRGAISGNAISGTSFASTGNMTFGDNDRAIFGAGSDLQIYSDGTTGQVTGNVDLTGTLVVNGSTAVTVSKGTTAQRPTGVAGMFRYNTTDGQFEGYTTSWGEIGQAVVLTGAGATTISGTYPNFTITSTDTNTDTNTTYSAGTGMTLSGTTFNCDIDSPSEVGLSNLSNSGNNLAGDFTATGNITAYSDASLKSNVNTIQDALKTVGKLRGVAFTRDDLNNEKQIGFIAQELEVEVPEVVFELDNGIKTVAYGNVVALLVEAIKELKAEVEALK